MLSNATLPLQFQATHLDLGSAPQALLPQLHHLDGVLDVHGHIARTAEGKRERHLDSFQLTRDPMVLLTVQRQVRNDALKSYPLGSSTVTKRTWAGNRAARMDVFILRKIDT